MCTVISPLSPPQTTELRTGDLHALPQPTHDLWNSIKDSLIEKNGILVPCCQIRKEKKPSVKRSKVTATTTTSTTTTAGNNNSEGGDGDIKQSGVGGGGGSNRDSTDSSPTLAAATDHGNKRESSR